MKNIYYIISLLSIATLSLSSQAHENNFIEGERLKYIIYYGIIDGGVIDAELNKLVNENGDVFHGKMLARSIGLTDKLFKIRDEYQGYFNPQTLLPYKAIRDINEGRYKKYHVDLFNHKAGKVTTLKGEVFDINNETRDMVSVFFYIRNIDYSEFKKGDIIKITTFFDDEIFPFDISFQGRETIKTRAGTYNCIKLVPFVEPGRIFNKEDDMTIWLSDDGNRVPIRVRFNLKVGSLKCDLVEFSGLKN